MIFSYHTSALSGVLLRSGRGLLHCFPFSDLLDLDIKKDRIVAIFDELSGLEKRYSDADGEFESIRFAILGKK